MGEIFSYQVMRVLRSEEGKAEFLFTDHSGVDEQETLGRAIAEYDGYLVGVGEPDNILTQIAVLKVIKKNTIVRVPLSEIMAGLVGKPEVS